MRDAVKMLIGFEGKHAQGFVVVVDDRITES